jgi:glycosyltransferase involved in cell wall biosynthesis
VLTVCYFGGYRPDYPRNLFYRRLLRQAGAEVIECRTSPRLPTLQKAAQLFFKFWVGPHRAHVLLVPEFNHTLVLLAWALARWRGMALVFDPGLSYYADQVLSLRWFAPHSWRARYLWWMEWLAYRLPDLVIWFTPVDEERFGKLFGIPCERSSWLPPGVNTDLFSPTSLPKRDSQLIIHWNGNMSPTHGVDVILRAAHRLAGDPAFRFEFSGGVLPEIKALADELQLPNVAFLGVVSPEELRASIQRAHVCLGVFRGDEKLERSLYTKEAQAMMAGRPLITGFGEVKSRLFKQGEELLMIPPEDPQALAEAIRLLGDNSLMCEKLAANGAAACAALYAPEATGGKLLRLLESVCAAQRR